LLAIVLEPFNVNAAVKESLNKAFDKLSATAPALLSHKDVANAENAGAVFCLPPT